MVKALFGDDASPGLIRKPKWLNDLIDGHSNTACESFIKRRTPDPVDFFFPIERFGVADSSLDSIMFGSEDDLEIAVIEEDGELTTVTKRHGYVPMSEADMDQPSLLGLPGDDLLFGIETEGDDISEAMEAWLEGDEIVIEVETADEDFSLLDWTATVGGGPNER